MTNISGNIFSVIPETLLILVEFPVTIMCTWVLLCWWGSAGFFSFLFYIVLGPVMFLGTTMGYLLINSWMDGVDPRLNEEHADWIVIKDEKL